MSFLRYYPAEVAFFPRSSLPSPWIWLDSIVGHGGCCLRNARERARKRFNVSCLLLPIGRSRVIGSCIWVWKHLIWGNKSSLFHRCIGTRVWVRHRFPTLGCRPGACLIFKGTSGRPLLRVLKPSTNEIRKSLLLCIRSTRVLKGTLLACCVIWHTTWLLPGGAQYDRQ